MRVLVLSSDEWAGIDLPAAFPGGRVDVVAHGSECLGRLRADPPDVLVVLPPVPWPSAAVALAAAAEGNVPAVVLPAGGGGALDRLTPEIVQELLAVVKAMG